MTGPSSRPPAPLGLRAEAVFDALHDGRGADLHPDDPELLYALTETHTGRGLATEAARALVACAREHAGFTTIVSAVDAPNTASIRVLEKVGFVETGRVPGAFGDTVLFTLR